MAELPHSIKYCIIGAGVHGLSTAFHLAQQPGVKGEDILVLDKTGVAAGASGIACGVVRNNYLQPAMGEVMRASVDVWESHADVLHYRPVGYVALATELQAGDLETTAARHERTGYRATLVRGERQTFEHMRRLFPDWKARGLSVCLHEHQGGFAFNKESMHGLADMARAAGVRIETGVTVTGFQFAADGAVTTVNTDRGEVAVEYLVVAVGPWIESLWRLLELPEKVDVRTRRVRETHPGPQAACSTRPTQPEGDELQRGLPMWTYWQLQEGEIAVDPGSYTTADGKTPPVMHVDSTEPLISDMTGKQITDALWGIYFKQDRHGVQGGAVPIRLGHEAQVDPYGPDSPLYTVKDDFADYWTAGLAHCLARFEGKSKTYKHAPTGGIGCFTVDSFPVFDFMRPNAYVIADSNHGYKMIGVGKEAARVLCGERSDVLHPFRFSRFAEGDLHPVSSGPFPWQ